MTNEEFEKISLELRDLAQKRKITLQWGMTQNDAIDNLIGNDFYDIFNYETLNNTVSNITNNLRGYFFLKENGKISTPNRKYEAVMSEMIKQKVLSSESYYKYAPQKILQYYQTRWFIRMCSICDEYLFCLDPRIVSNPNEKSKLFDIRTKNGLYHFDIKDSRIPKALTTECSSSELIDRPSAIIDFYYNRQSRERRDGLQNRLFIINHSEKNNKNEPIVRTEWECKKKAFTEFIDKIEAIKFYHIDEKVISAIIFITENKDGDIEWKIPMSYEKD